MSLTRRLILAAALIVGVAPAFAQVPPPVPALPDTERRTTYTITASICSCSVNFALYGDSTDVANWLEVFVNGVRISQPGNWTLSTAATGGLANAARPITDAVLTFTAAQTGTVQIVGARRPRRASQFTTQPSARDFNQVLTDIIAQNRESWDKTNDVSGRVPQAPPGETMALLPVLASRASMAACFDSGGNLTSCVAASGSFTAGNGIAFTGSGPTSISADISAGQGIKLTGTHPIVISSNASFVTPADFGAICDGVTDFHTQLQNMITGSVGKVIYIPPGPACLTSVTLTMPSNTNITGGGREFSTIKGTAIAANPILSATNASNISLTNFALQGSDSIVSWAVSSFGALKIVQDVSAVATGSNFTIKGMKFSGFNVSYWIYVSTVGSTPGLNNFSFVDNYIQSASGDIPTDGTISNNNNYGLVFFTATGGAGRIENTTVSDNRMDATGICFPITLFANHYKWQIDRNIVLSAGITTPAHCTSGVGTINSYGILIYDLNADGNPPTNGLIDGNTIISPYATGIYMAGDGTPGHNANNFNSSNSIISNNLITGQVSQDDSLLPRGAISVAFMTDIDFIGNKAIGGFGGYTVAGQTTGLLNFVGNSCFTVITSVSANPSCVRMDAGANGSSNTTRHIFKSNYFENTGTTTTAANLIRASSLTGSRFNDVEFSDNTINTGWAGLNFTNQFASGSVVFKNNKFGGVANNFMMNVAGLTGARAAIMGNVFDSTAGVAGNALIVNSSVVDMVNNKFMNRASGVVAMFNGTGTCGTIVGTTFSGVVQPAMVVGGSLGTTNPSGCTLNYMDQVQNLTPSELGAGGFGTAGQKFVTDHWLHVSTTASTTHVDQRILTGN